MAYRYTIEIDLVKAIKDKYGPYDAFYAQEGNSTVIKFHRATALTALQKTAIQALPFVTLLKEEVV
jgi:hypothetical protein